MFPRVTWKTHMIMACTSHTSHSTTSHSARALLLHSSTPASAELEPQNGLRIGPPTIAPVSDSHVPSKPVITQPILSVILKMCETELGSMSLS